MITRPRSAAWLAFVTASLMSILACQRVPLLAPSGSTITLTTTTNALPVNGTTQLVAQIIEPAGTPPQRGTHVTFTTTLGTIQPAETETNVNGQAIVTFNAGGASGTATITAISGGANVGTTGGLKILVGTAAVGRVIVNATPQMVPALGGTSTISANVLDVNGNPLVASPVSFSTTAGTLNTTLATTDQNGNAQAVLTTFTAATVTASVGATATTPTTPTQPPSGGTTPTTPAAAGQASGSVTVGIAGSPTLVIAPPATLSAGLPAVFTITAGAATANGSPVRQVTINWGDRSATQDLGAISGATSVAHVYASPGTYPIVATITDAFGSVVNVSITVTVNPKPQPVVTLALASGSSNPTAGTDVAFTGSITVASGSNTVIQSASIDFGDGTKTELGAATGTITLHHVYQAAGNYTVTLAATDSNGGVGTGVTTVFVQAATPLGVSITYTKVTDPNNALAQFTATVTGLGNAVVIQYLWDFGDGESQVTTTNQVTHNYSRPSVPPTRTVRVTITTSDNRTTSGTTTITP